MPNKDYKNYYFIVPVYTSESDGVPFIDVTDIIPAFVSDDYDATVKMARKFSKNKKLLMVL